MAVLRVNGAAVPTPSEMTVGVYDIASTADRNAKGNVVIDRVNTKRKLELVWAALSPADMSTLLKAVGTNVFFSVEYPDPVTGGVRTMSCYSGDRTAGIFRIVDGAPVWVDIKMNWIER